MKRAIAILALILALPSAAHAFTVSGRFLYEDRIWNGNGYTGTVQNLPIRRAQVEIVNVATTLVLASGVTDGNGNYSIDVTGQAVPVSFYARCLTDGRPNYQIWVVDAPNRDLMGGWVPPNAPVHAITTGNVLLHNPASPYSFGDYLIQDTDGTGVAQAFNIFDCAVDFFDWISQPGVLGRLPNASEYVTYSWGPMNSNEGSNYTRNTILLASPGQGNDTDAWSDTVILHETGHWYDDNFSRSDNPGGPHFIGDNDANIKLAYGEGTATYHCAKVRERRALVHGSDNLVSLYGDLMIPPPVGTSGGLSFSYDFETGNFGNDGRPIGQIGSANETNVTSALWDLMDGPGTPDATPGTDDDLVEVDDSYAWAIENSYLPSIPSGNTVTVEDYWQGWFALNGAGFMRSGLENIFVTLAKMPFIADGLEPDGTLATAGTITPMAHTVSGTGKVVINELHLGALDAIELYNSDDTPVDLTGWKIEVFANGLAPQDSINTYVFPTFTLNPGEVVVVHEAGTPIVDDGPVHLFAGNQQNFNAAWNSGLDGACLLRDAANTPVDFVKWRDAGGENNHTAVPAGLTYTGLLDTPPAPNTMARDISGTDTDAAADFSGHYGSLGSANHPSPQYHTLFDTGDQDVIGFLAVAGTRYGFETKGPYSKSDPRIELLDASGAVIGSNDNYQSNIRDARLDYLAGSSTEDAGSMNASR
ncbi:MAG: lamin tail domain-containing protein [Candidatus Eisenbacteria bacterium]